MKNSTIERLLSQLSPTGMGPDEAHFKQLCAWCGEPATLFRDEVSRLENEVSGFCQKCQDEVFVKIVILRIVKEDEND